MPATVDSPSRRISSRTNTLLAATATQAESSWPVRLRNLSSHGAMLEAEMKADVGTSLIISRGALRAAGIVVWRRDGIFGIRLVEPLKVDEWLSTPTKEALPSIDQPSLTAQDIPEDILRNRIAEEIAYVARMTNNVSDLLSADPVLRLRHSMQIQELCIGEQMLHEIAALLQQVVSCRRIQEQATGPMRNRLLRNPPSAYQTTP